MNAIETEGVLDEVFLERESQDAKWGVQNHPNGTGGNINGLKAEIAKMECEDAVDCGALTWQHILAEEVAEAFAESDPVFLRAELVQCAAVCTAWVAAIDRKAKKP